MDFTREPIIETVITPKEGCKLVVRSSKSTGQEEYFVDALEVVSFGNAMFLRSLERPKSFLVPASDYEVLEVREARMVLKNVGIERTIKIGGGKAAREEKPEPVSAPEPAAAATATATGTQAESSDTTAEGKLERRRDRRRHGRRRRERGNAPNGEQEAAEDKEEGIPATAAGLTETAAQATPPPSGGYPTTIIPPPSMLISETIARYRDNALFKEAFYVKEEQKENAAEAEKGATPGEHPEDLLEALSMRSVSLEPSEYGSFGMEEEHNGDWIPPLPEEDSQSEGAPSSRQE